MLGLPLLRLLDVPARVYSLLLALPGGTALYGCAAVCCPSVAGGDWGPFLRRGGRSALPPGTVLAAAPHKLYRLHFNFHSIPNVP